ncbi:transcription factor FapR [Desulfofalx alkaliphila]|uniref:transcription factor FapR n=1 Tax=Desulfofalx alkaliphila TaxID=105483 RepID=UPI0004E22B6D|nr:transcription factor FapR [Desulfofalx alkaliphila]
MVRKSSARKKRHNKLVEYISNNPFLTDEDLAEILGVSVQTIRLDRSYLGIPELRVRLKQAARGNAHNVKSMSYGEVVGELVEIEVGKTGSSLLAINEDMVFKKNLIARGHHLFAQANSLAVAIIDATTALTGNAKVTFRQQVLLGERVLARAEITGRQENRYRVTVVSTVKNKVVFEGIFTIFAVEEEAD